MWHVGWVGVALFVVFSGIAAIAVGPRFARLGKVFGRPPSPLDALPAAGAVVVRGKVVSDGGPLPAGPFSRLPAARVEVEVGPKKALKGGAVGIDVRLSTEVGARFALEDAQGRRVSVEGADPAVLDSPSISEGRVDEAALRAYLAANGRQASDFAETLEDGRYCETAIREGAEVHAWGELRGGVLRAPEGGKLVLTTERPESYRSLVFALKVTFVIFAAISLVLVAIGLVGARLEGPAP